MLERSSTWTAFSPSFSRRRSVCRLLFFDPSSLSLLGFSPTANHSTSFFLANPSAALVPLCLPALQFRPGSNFPLDVRNLSRTKPVIYRFPPFFPVRAWHSPRPTSRTPLFRKLMTIDWALHRVSLSISSLTAFGSCYIAEPDLPAFLFSIPSLLWWQQGGTFSSGNCT